MNYKISKIPEKEVNYYTRKGGRDYGSYGGLVQANRIWIDSTFNPTINRYDKLSLE